MLKGKNPAHTIKIGNVKINSISKSIKSLRIKDNFLLFGLDCTPSVKHIKYCIKSTQKSFSAADFLKKLTGEKQASKLEKKIELNKSKNACLVVFGKNKKEAETKAKKLEKIFGLKENKKLISEKKRLKKLAEKEKINLNGFGEEFYSSIDNFFIEKSALI